MRSILSRGSHRIPRQRSAPIRLLNPFTAHSGYPSPQSARSTPSARAVIPTIITQALTSNSIKLGSLTPVRDLMYVTDTVQGFIQFAESKKTVGKTINTGSGKGVTIGELADMIIAQVNPKARIVTDDKRVRPENSEVMKLVCDNRLARDLAGWEPKVSLKEGISMTIDWMKEHVGSYKTGIYTV